MELDRKDLKERNCASSFLLRLEYLRRASQVASFVIDERYGVLAERPALPLVVYLARLVLAPLGILAQPGQTPVQPEIIILQSFLPRRVSSASVPTNVLVEDRNVASPPPSPPCQRSRYVAPSLVQLVEIRDVLQAPPRIGEPRLG